MAVSMGAHVSAPVFYPNLRYDPRTDFEPVGLTANAPAAIAAKKDLPVNNLKEFIAYVKAHGADVKQAHGGIGATSHMACLLFNKLFDLHPTLVAYRGTGPAVNDLIGGHVDYYCEQAVSVAPGVKGGLIKGLVVSGNERLAALPDVPTAKEAGAPDFQLNVWSGVFAPKGTPKDVDRQAERGARQDAGRARHRGKAFQAGRHHPGQGRARARTSAQAGAR